MKNTTQHNILTGGTAENPQYIVAESVKPVTLAEILSAGNALGAATFNLMIGNVSPDLTTPDAMKQWPRSLKNDKSAFNRLLDQKPETMRLAWEAAQKTRVRYTMPTLQALDKAVKAYNNPDAGGEKKLSVAEQVAAILKGKGTDKTKVAAIAALEQVAKILNAE